MSFFSSSATSGSLQVDVPPMKVYVSRANANGADNPTFDDFELETRLQCKSIFYGSSAAGQSYARLEGASGQPVSAQVDVEDSDMILPGDRVCIGFDEDGTFRALFAGFLVQAQIQIADNSELIAYRVAGPEWAWGANGRRTGATSSVSGQFRRKAQADETWLNAPATITARDDLIRVRAERTVFNPRGMKNRTKDQVYFVPSGEKGYVFEEPDRAVIEGGDREEKAEYWTRKKAIHHLVHMYNDADFTGIANPVFGSVDPTVSGDVMRDVDVDGMSLWEALAKVCGPGLGIAVNPVPSSGFWGGFELKLFNRADGTAANLFLDPRGTSMAEATPSVNRVEAVKDFSKSANRVTVYGRGIRHLLLRFNADFDAVASAEKPYTLQPGWVSDDGKLEDYANAETDLAKAVVDKHTIDAKGADEAIEWKENFTTGGAKYRKYAHVFRRFVWNEAAEFKGDGVTYGKTDGEYFFPNLTGIADAKGFVATEDYVAGQYARRRRPLLDTPYTLPGKPIRVKEKPIVYISTKYGGEWRPEYTRRLTDSEVQIDQTMAAIWISVPDIANWYPFQNVAYKRERDDPSLPAGKPPAAAWIAQKTFATLLYSKQLWLTVDASIEVDMPARAVAERTNASGNPHVRQILIRRDDAYVKSITQDQSALGTNWARSRFGGLTLAPIDDTEDMQTFADQSRESLQDEQVQASILCEGDWPIQGIGKMVNSIGGRNINLTSASGKGAQIVAIAMDCESMTIEHLTESAAMEVVAAEKNRIARSRVYRQGGIQR